jgi:hypothetical protein
MRRILVVVFVLALFLLAGMAVLLYRTSLRPQLTAPIAAIPPNSPLPADRESPFATPKPKETTDKLPTRLEPLPMRLAPSDTKQEPEATLPKDQQTALKYPFPMGSEIGVGKLKPEILATFGPPQVTVTSTSGGQLQERLIYADLPTGTKTAIAVIDGKVASAETYAAESAQE